MTGNTKAEETKQPIKSPWGLRLLILAGSGLFGILLIWLIGYMLHDIGTFRRVDYADVERQFVSVELDKRREAAAEEIERLKVRIAAAAERRAAVKEGIDVSKGLLQDTLDAHEAQLRANQPVSAELQAALAQAQRAYLQDQMAYQKEHKKGIEENLELQGRRRASEKELAEIVAKIAPLVEKARAEQRRLQEKYDIQAAFLKLLVLLPAALLAAWLFLKKRGGPMTPIVYVTGLAVLWHLIAVIHHHFPERYHKYIFVALALAVVLRVLVYLVRVAAAPSAKHLLKRFREAYTKRRRECPICGFAILAPDGQAALMRARTRGRQLVLSPAEGEEERPYTCPSCGTALYETCEACQKVRHSLLPNCQHCGATKEPEAAAPA